jgi:NAD(P)H-quinone oxidoreductase subunit 5
MTFPLMALAVPSMLVGLLGTPFANYFEAFIHPPGEVEEVWRPLKPSTGASSR